MTDIKCSCGESMDLYDEQELKGRTEKYFICNSCGKKKKQIIITNDNGAEIFNEVVDE